MLKPWLLNPELMPIRDELEKLNALESLDICIHRIEQAAAEVKEVINNPTNSDSPYSPDLEELNKLHRSLKGSHLSEPKILAKIGNLSQDAYELLQVTLSGVLDSEDENPTIDFSKIGEREDLLKAVGLAREWLRETPGTKQQIALQEFSRQVEGLYRELTNNEPGVGGDRYDKDSPTSDGKYQTPFERLWIAALRIIEPEATTYRAREIYRAATRPRSIKDDCSTE